MERFSDSESPLNVTLRILCKLEGVKLLPILLFAGLVACAPSANRLDTAALRSNSVVQNLKPNKGEGATYKIGEQVRFTYALDRAGYATLLTTDSDGGTYDLERGIALKSGAGVLPRATDTNATGAQAAYLVDIPTGPQRVFLIFTDKPGPAGSRISGKFDNAGLQKAIRTYIAASNATVYDVAETEFEVVK